MPELPEVQNTVDGLRQTIVGKKIASVWTDYGSAKYQGKTNIKDPAYFETFQTSIQGRSITDVTRRAKQIFIHLDDGTIIAVHMKMTGHFLIGSWDWNTTKKIWQPESGFWDKSWDISKEEVRKTMPLSDPFNNFIHLMITCGDGSQIAFSDMRKFATIFLISDPQEYQSITDSYGPEPLASRLSFDEFMSRLKTRPRMMVKPALLDQSLIAGFGNIYSDEVLWYARVHPESLVSMIPEQQWRDIFHYGKKILRSAIRHGGDSDGDYRRVDGTGGTYHGMHRVYRRDGQDCFGRCGSMIEKKQIGQRIGRYCPHCQIYYS